MAKSKLSNSSGDKDQKEVMKIIKDLQSVIEITNSSTKEQVRINRELLKTIALIENGFVSNAKEANELISKVKLTDFQLSDDMATKMAKLRKISKKDLTETLKQFRDIEKKNSEIITDNKEINKLKKESNTLLDTEVGLTKNILGNYDQILAAVQASKRQINQFGAGLGDVTKILKSTGNEIDFDIMFDGGEPIANIEKLISNMKSDLSSMIASASGDTFNVDLKFNPLTDDLEVEIAKSLKNIELEKNARIDALRTTFKENDKLQTQMLRQMVGNTMQIDVDIDTGQIKTLEGILEPGTEEFEKMAKKLDEIAQAEGIKNNLIPQFDELADLIGLGSKMTIEQIKRYDELVKPIGIAGQLLSQQTLFHLANLNALEQQIGVNKKILNGFESFSQRLQTADSIVNSIADGFEYVNRLMPEGISKFIGLSKISEELINAQKKGVESFAAEIEKSGNATLAWQGYLKAFAPALSLALNPLLLMGVAAVLLFKFVSGITGKFKEMSQTLGTSLGQSKDLYQVQLDTLTSQKNQFSTMEDIQAVQKAMIASGGTVLDQTNKDAQELSTNLVEVGKYFGYGTERAVELQNTFEKLGANKKLSVSLQRNLGYMAEMAGLSPQMISQDLVDSAEVVSTYFAGMPDKAASAAIQVRRMGLSLQQAGKIAQNMLNLEGFMTDMYELQAMTGGAMDFSEAFDKGLMGDIVGMTDSIMTKIGSTADLNEMDFLTRSKIAKTLGMSNDELAKSVMLHEKSNGLDKKTKEFLDKNLDRLGDISSMSQEDIKNKMASLQSTDRLGVAWEKIQGVLTDAILPFVESFADGIDAIYPIIDIVILGLKGVAATIKFLSPLIKGVFAPFEFVAEVLNSIISGTNTFGDGLKSAWSTLDDFGKAFYAIGAVVGLIFSPKIFMGLFDGIQGILSKIPFIGKLFGGANKTAKETASSSDEAVRSMASSVESSLGSMASSFKSTFQGIATFIKETFAEIGNSSKTVSESATAVSAKVASSLQTDTTAVSSSTKKMVKDAEVGLDKVQSKVKSSGKLSLFSSDSAKKGLGTLGEIASKTLGAFVMKSAFSFLTMKKDGEEKTSELTDGMQGMFGLAFAGVGSLLVEHLTDGIQSVFTKKLEKHIETKLENPIKKLSKAFDPVGQSGEKAFDSVENKGKGVFGRLADFAKKMLPKSTSSIAGTFDNLADQGVIKPMSSVQDIAETVSTKKKSIIESTVQSKTIDIPEKINIPDVKKPIADVSKKTGDGLGSFGNILKSVWNGIKTILKDIVKFVSTSMKELSSGIGTAIKNVLKGIGDGLGSFKSSALKGAAALVILSGALWITSKAVQNFASVKWEDLAKAGVAMAGLVGASLLLGSAAMPMIIGAAAIAILGASLIPLAFGMKMFNDINWDSLGKAGVALIGFGVIAVGFAAIAPLILTGSLVIGAASASLLLFGGAVFGMNLALQNLDLKPLKELTVQLMNLVSIPISQLLGLSVAITSVGASLLAFQTMTSIGNIGSGISKMFGGDVVKDLEKLGNLSDPLYIVQNVLTGLNDALMILSETLANLDLSGIEKLGKVGEIGIDAQVNQKIKPLIDNLQTVQQDSTKVKMSPVQTPVANVQVPKKESVAQDQRITSTGGVQHTDQSGKVISTVENNFQNTERFSSQKDNYNEDTVSDNLETNMLMKQMIQLLTIIAKKNPELVLDGQKVHTSLKKYNNN